MGLASGLDYSFLRLIALFESLIVHLKLRPSAVSGLVQRDSLDSDRMLFVLATTESNRAWNNAHVFTLFDEIASGGSGRHQSVIPDKQ